MRYMIDIPEDIVTDIKDHCGMSIADAKEVLPIILNAIHNGTPLPKGHGELIDRDKIEYLKAIHDAKYGHISWGEATKRIKYSAPTIIEADMESRNEE